jgi:hypothetical protein
MAFRFNIVPISLPSPRPTRQPYQRTIRGTIPAIPPSLHHPLDKTMGVEQAADDGRFDAFAVKSARCD